MLAERDLGTGRPLQHDSGFGQRGLDRLGIGRGLGKTDPEEVLARSPCGERGLLRLRGNNGVVEAEMCLVNFATLSHDNKTPHFSVWFSTKGNLDLNDLVAFRQLEFLHPMHQAVNHRFLRGDVNVLEATRGQDFLRNRRPLAQDIFRAAVIGER